MYNTKTLSGMAFCLGLILAAPAFGGTIAYVVTVNTSSAAGTTGYIDLDLAPGTLGAPGVTVAINNFSGSTLSTNTTMTGTTTGTNLYYIDGDVSTSPMSSPILLSNSNTLTLINDKANNELTQALTFGTTTTFWVTLSGPGVLGGTSGISGTAFTLDFLNDAQNTWLFTSDPTANTTSLWATDLIYISNTGAVTTVENPGPGGGTPLGILTLVPEPGSLLMFATGVLLIVGLGKKLRAARP